MGWPCFMMALAFASSCSTPSSVAPISIPLVYKTMAEPGDFPSLPACASLSGVEVVDGRAEKTIGKRFIEGNASTVVPVTTSSDVATWAPQWSFRYFEELWRHNWKAGGTGPSTGDRRNQNERKCCSSLGLRRAHRCFGSANSRRNRSVVRPWERFRGELRVFRSCRQLSRDT